MRARRREDKSEYQVVRRWPLVVAARVYEAFHRRTGAPALVLRPGRPGDWQPAARPWSAKVKSTPHQLAVELERLPGSAAELEEVTLAFHRLTGVLAQAEERPAPLLGEAARARRWHVRPGYLAALAAAVALALVARPRSGSEASRKMLADAGAAAQLAPAAAAQPVAMAPRPALVALALPMPKEPFKGQARPDKAGKCEGAAERAIRGGCWVALRDLSPPCDNRSYEYQGGCYLPVWPPLKEPQAALRGEAEKP
jgi:hypothetical protein